MQDLRALVLPFGMCHALTATDSRQQNDSEQLKLAQSSAREAALRRSASMCWMEAPHQPKKTGGLLREKPAYPLQPAPKNSRGYRNISCNPFCFFFFM